MPTFAGLLLLSTGAAAGGSLWGLCGDPPPAVSYPETGTNDPIHVDADSGLFDQARGQGVLTGDVQMRQGGRFLRADQLRLFQPVERAEAEGNVLYREGGLEVEAPEARMLLDTGDLEATDLIYRIEQRHARGHADYALREDPKVLNLTNGSFSTCPWDIDSWSLFGRDITLDQNTGVGTAKHVLFKVKGVPILYSPYAQFPLDKRRKTGFLIPSFGTTGNSGYEFTVPFYLNLAPNYDATLTARLLTERGVQWRPTVRYLFPGTRGRLDFEYLPDRKADKDRYLIDFRHSSQLTPRWRADLVYESVSDDRYFNDLGNSLEVTSLAILPRKADLRYNGGFWSALARVQNYQTIDPTIAPANRPYERLPQFLIKAREPEKFLGFGYDAHGEWVNFGRDTGATGSRLDGQIGLDWPFTRPGYFTIPSASFRLTDYILEDTAPGQSDRITRAIPTVSLDSGLIFERGYRSGRFIQTLEPRLFYLYVPFQDQSDIPVFDTSSFDFTYPQLFSDNRFTGVDRIGDANQLSYALTSSLLDTTTGAERAALSIGQILYFEERRVTLPGGLPQTDDFSNIIADLTVQITSSWRAQLNTQLNPYDNDFERTSARLRYRSDGRHVLNLGYSEKVGQFQQTDVSFAWPLSPNWLVVGRWNYDLLNERNQTILGGIEYDSCCWAARLVARQFINGADGETNESIQFQVVLKGLTNLGNSVQDLLEKNIVGYGSNF